MKRKLKEAFDWFRSLGVTGWLLMALIAYMIYAVLRSVFRNLFRSGQKVANVITDPIEAAKYGVNLGRVNQLKQLAKDLQYAIWDWSYLVFVWDHRYTEDEGLVIFSINQCQTINEVKFVCDEFMKLYPPKVPAWAAKKTLRQCVLEYLTANEQKQIRSDLFNALK